MDFSSNPLFLVLGVIVGPAVIAGIVLLWAARRRAAATIGGVGAIAFTLAYAAGHRASLTEWPAIPPGSSKEALFYAALIAGAAALTASCTRPRWLRFALVGAAHAAAAALVLWNLLERASTASAAGTLAALFVLAAAITAGCERFAERERGSAAPLVLWLVASATAAGHVLTGSVIYTQFSATLAAILGAAVVVAYLARDTSFAGGLCLAIVPHELALLEAGVHLSDMPHAAALALAVAPLAPLCLPLRWTAGTTPTRRLALQLFASSIPVAIALALCAMRHFETAGNGYGV